MNRYYIIDGRLECGTTDRLFGSFNEQDNEYEYESELDNWLDSGYVSVTRGVELTTEQPDPLVYPELFD